MKGNFQKLISGAKPVLIDFHATWCGPCKAQAPVIKLLAKEMHEKLRVVKIDIDKNKQIAHRYKIKSVPTLVLFKNGRILWQEPGVKTKAQLTKIINQKI